MPIPVGPNVEELFSEYSRTLERWLDRWKSGVENARNGHYTFEQLANDVTRTWIDGAMIAMTPLSVVGALTLTSKPPFPVLRVEPATRADLSRMLSIPNLAPGNIAAENLRDASGVNQIPNANVALAQPVPTHVRVSFVNLAALPIPGGLYRGNIVHQATNTPVARIEILLP